MKRFGKGQMVWVPKGRKTNRFSISPSPPKDGDLEAARYVKPGDNQGTHVVTVGGRNRLVFTSDIVTKTDKNLRDTEELLKS